MDMFDLGLDKFIASALFNRANYSGKQPRELATGTAGESDLQGRETSSSKSSQRVLASGGAGDRKTQVSTMSELDLASGGAEVKKIPFSTMSQRVLKRCSK